MKERGQGALCNPSNRHMSDPIDARWGPRRASYVQYFGFACTLDPRRDTAKRLMPRRRSGLPVVVLASKTGLLLSRLPDYEAGVPDLPSLDISVQTEQMDRLRL